MDLQRLRQRILRDSTVSQHSCHGPEHWARVERNALYLAEHSDADPTIVRLFAMLHDCRRECDGYDPEHGKRAAEYAETLPDSLIQLDPVASRELAYALCWHTAGNEVLSDTIGVCWDADRLDLGRVGLRPDPKYLYTEEAKRIAACSDWQCLHRFGDKLATAAIRERHSLEP